MRIKRFFAPDMRTALKMVREEHGPDAVILSNRPVHGGIEVVAATDYDEALVQQALRTAAEPAGPGAAPVPSFAPAYVETRPATALDALEDFAPATLPLAQPHVVRTEKTASRAEAMIAALAGNTSQAERARAALAARARGVARIDAEAANPPQPALAAMLRQPTRADAPADAVAAVAEPGNPAALKAGDDFRALLARLTASDDPEPRLSARAISQVQGALPESPAAAHAPADAEAGDAATVAARAQAPRPAEAASAVAGPRPAPAPVAAPAIDAPGEAAPGAPARADVAAAPSPAAAGFADLAAPAPAAAGFADLAAPAPAAAGFADLAAPAPAAAALPATPAPTFAELVDTIPAAGPAPHAPPQPVVDSFDALAEMAAAQLAPPAPATAPPSLQIVASQSDDPTIVAMRNELASMRQMIERQMGQFAVERLRGSPARATAFETLQAYGVDDALAQTIASRIDARLEPAKVRAPLLAELARMLTIARSEPLEDGGVFALIGPTGAGKTTTLAKLAARFAQRHRARDVALVTTDVERPGAREQLHALGRKLGITVCEAEGPEGLTDALDQLVDYPLVLVDTAGYAARDKALLGQVTWLRATRNLRSLLVLPANLQQQDMAEAVRRYRMAAPEAVVLTKLDETGRLGGALSVAIKHGLPLAYTTAGQQVPADLEAADASRLVLALEKLRRAADNPLATEERHVVA